MNWWTIGMAVLFLPFAADEYFRTFKNTEHTGVRIALSLVWAVVPTIVWPLTLLARLLWWIEGRFDIPIVSYATGPDFGDARKYYELRAKIEALADNMEGHIDYPIDEADVMFNNTLDACAEKVRGLLE